MPNVADLTDVAVVIPARDEQESIAATLRGIRKALPTAALIVVVDRADDPTVVVVQTLRELAPPARIVVGERPGPKEAIVAGARANGAGTLLFMNADGADDPRTACELVAAIADGADLAVGSRLATGGGRIGGPLLKNLLADLAGRALYATGALPIRDATNTFLAVRRTTFESALPLRSRGFAWGLELRRRVLAAGGRIVERPTCWRDRTRGRSKFPWRRLPEYGREALLCLTAPRPRHVLR